MKSSTVILSNSRHDHIRNSVVLFKKKSRNSYAVAPSASAVLFFLTPKHMNFGNVCAAFFRRRIDFLRKCLNNEWSGTRSRILEGQEKKDISRKQGCAWISQHKLHYIDVPLISDLFKEHSHLQGSSKASKCFFRLRRHCKSKTRDARAGVLRMSGRTRFLLFFMLIGETAATCVDVRLCTHAVGVSQQHAIR